MPFPPLLQFPPQSSATADEQKVFVLWENGETFDKVTSIFFIVATWFNNVQSLIFSLI